MCTGPDAPKPCGSSAQNTHPAMNTNAAPIRSSTTIDAPHVGGTVRSCVCLGVSFERIREAAGGDDSGLLEAHRVTGCGGRCGLCIPYIKLMLMTGHTALPVMWSEEFSKRGISPGRVKSIERAIARQQAAMDAGANTRSAAD